MSLVDMCDDMDFRWTTDDQKSYDIVLSLPSFYKLLSSRCLVQGLLKSKLAFRNKLHKEPLLPQHIVVAYLSLAEYVLYSVLLH